MRACRHSMRLFLLLSLLQATAVVAFNTVFVSVPFPQVEISKALALLHGPEKWASGAGLMAAVPTFSIQQVMTPLRLHRDKVLVQFRTNSRHVIVEAGCPYSVVVSVSKMDEDQKEAVIHARIMRYSEQRDRGFALSLKVETTANAAEWAEALRHSLRAALFSTTTSEILHKKLALYRCMVQKKHSFTIAKQACCTAPQSPPQTPSGC